MDLHSETLLTDCLVQFWKADVVNFSRALKSQAFQRLDQPSLPASMARRICDARRRSSDEVSASIARPVPRVERVRLGVRAIGWCLPTTVLCIKRAVGLMAITISL